MSKSNVSDGFGERSDPNLDDPSGRLSRYLARTQTPLDLLALLTLWIVVVPPSDFGSAHHATTVAWVVRIGVSVVYAVDITIRSVLATRHLRYALRHPLSLIAVPLPPVRVVFSLRLVGSVFRRGNLARFLLAAGILVLNGAAIVYLFENGAKGSNIQTFGESVWWSVVTVTTVGYGDFFPVTPAGRVTAVFIMAIGILTLAVVTAQVASSFVDQGARRRAPDGPEPGTDGSNGPALADLDRRLARIEALLAANAATLESLKGKSPPAGSP
jgi:voltage-gated potassium channel